MNGAGVRLAVLHRTSFFYGAPVTHSVNTLHLEPQDFPYQKTLSSLIRVIPAVRLRRFTDLFQNATHQFDLPEPHLKLEVESRLRVCNQPLDLSEASRQGTMDDISDPSVREWIWAYLQESRWVSKSPEIWRAAVDVTLGIPSVFGQASALMEWINREFTYESGVTEVNTHLDEVFAHRHGVCQDFAHVMIGMCRTLGLPARYASGYLYNGPSGVLLGSQASHAWCEVYLPEAGWIGFDPTNSTLADERYVKVAVGRDYDDVAPIEGSYRGTAHCRMEVHVEVKRI
jgi:transglutaminase-like putative cysteine protease